MHELFAVVKFAIKCRAKLEVTFSEDETTYLIATVGFDLSDFLKDGSKIAI